MSDPEELDDPDDSDVVVAEQAPISVYTNGAGAVVINQFQWQDGPVCIFVIPHNAAALCRAILEQADVDLDTAEPKVDVKDATANERQRRRRERLRDSHNQNSVTVTAELANDVDGAHQEIGSTTAG